MALGIRTKTAFRTLLLPVALCLTAAACDDSNPLDAGLEATTADLAVVSGQSQSGRVGTELADPFVVRVVDSRGRPVDRSIVNFRVIEGDGKMRAGYALTDDDGLARDWLTLGSAAGTNRVEARAVLSRNGRRVVYGTFTARAVTGTGSAQTSTSSNGSNATNASRTPGAPTVSVRALGRDSVEVRASWNRVSGARSYRWMSATGSYRWQRTGTASGTSVTVRAPRENATYGFCVEAVGVRGGPDLADNCTPFTAPSSSPSPAPAPAPSPTPRATTVTVTPESSNLAVGQSLQLNATVRTSNGSTPSNPELRWTSNNSNIVSVDSRGRVTARAAGTAMIIVSAACCSAADSVTIVVDPPSSGGNGNTTPFFSDSFDNGRLTSAGGFQWAGGGPTVSTERARSGSHALRFRFRESGGHDWAEQRFSLGRNVTELWVEYWIWYPSNYTHRNASPSNNKFFRLWGGDYGAENKVGASTWAGGAGGASRFRFDYTMARGSGIGPGESPTVEWGDASMRGRWSQVRMYYKHATRAQNDGVMRIWKDGRIVADFRNVDQKYTSQPYWNAGYILGYDNSGFQQETIIYVDDVRFWDRNPGW